MPPTRNRTPAPQARLRELKRQTDVLRPGSRRVRVRSVMLLACGIALILAAIVRTGGRASADHVTPPAAGLDTPGVNGRATAAVDAFSACVLQQSARAVGAPNDEYVRDCLRLLDAAIALIAERESLFVASSSGAVAGEPGDSSGGDAAPHNGGVIDPAPGRFRATADAITNLQRQRFAHLDRAAAQLRKAAGAIAAEQPLAIQRVAIETFFERASDVLRGMAEIKL